MKLSHSYSKRRIAFLKGYRKYFPFFICLAISFTFWLTREMGKTYNEQISVAVCYINVPKSKVLVSYVPEKILVTVESTGWGLWKYYFFSDSEITVDVGSYDERGISRLSTRDASFLNSLGNQFKVLDVYPNEVVFSYETMASKFVPVKTDVSITFGQQFELDGELQIQPDSVFVYGASKDLEKITSVQCESVEMKKVKEAFSVSVNVKPLANVSISEDQIVVSGKVAKFTEQSITVPIKLLNVPQDSSILVDLMKDKVTIAFLVPISRVEDYFPSDFEAVADFEKKTASGMVPVEIVRSPKFVRVIRQNPEMDGVISEILDR